VNFVEEETVEAFLDRLGVEARDNVPDIEDVLNELETQLVAEIDTWTSPAAPSDDDKYPALEVPKQMPPMKPLTQASEAPAAASTAPARSVNPERRQRTLLRTDRLTGGMGLRTTTRRSRQAPASPASVSEPSEPRPAQPAALPETDAEVLRKTQEAETQRTIAEIVSLSPEERSQAAIIHLLGAIDSGINNNNPKFMFAYLNILADPDLEDFREASIKEAFSLKPPDEAKLVHFNNVILCLKDRRENWTEELFEPKASRVDAMLNEWDKLVKSEERLGHKAERLGTAYYTIIRNELATLNLPPPKSQIAPPEPRRARRQPTAWPPKT
jgi:hypothetical protein